MGKITFLWKVRVSGHNTAKATKLDIGKTLVASAMIEKNIVQFHLYREQAMSYSGHICIATVRMLATYLYGLDHLCGEPAGLRG
jgi:hypothetical protein